MKKGSIALLSMLIISAFTLILVVAMSEINLSTSYQYLNNTANKTSYAFAESCFEEGLLRLEADSAFTGTTLIFDTNAECTIAVSGTSPKIMAITVQYGDYEQTFSGQVSLEAAGQVWNATLWKWQET